MLKLARFRVIFDTEACESHRLALLNEILKYLYIKPDILIIYRYAFTVLFFCFTLLITFLIASCFY